MLPDIQRWTFDGVSMAVTTEVGTAPDTGFGRFNLAQHVGDDPEQVQSNRETLVQTLQLPGSPLWLNQVHGNDVVEVSANPGYVPTADASITSCTGLPLAILSADCLPILLWDHGNTIAAVHAGWRGLANGVIKRCIERFPADVNGAFIGPGIGACHYEVDERVKAAFEHGDAFRACRPGHYDFDLVAEARRQLNESGVSRVITSDICTAGDPRFYSYRRDGETGRFATLIWR